MNDWKIGKIRAHCYRCENDFEDDQKVVSVVEIDADDNPVRHDFCAGCMHPDDPEVANQVGNQVGIYWETRFHLQPEDHKRKIDFNRLLRVFDVWVKQRPPGQEALVYLIALLLVRKRYFRMLDLVSEEDGEYLRLKRPGPEGETVHVLAPLITIADIPPLRERLEDLIDGDLDDADVEDAVPD